MNWKIQEKWIKLVRTKARSITCTLQQHPAWRWYFSPFSTIYKLKNLNWELPQAPSLGTEVSPLQAGKETKVRGQTLPSTSSILQLPSVVLQLWQRSLCTQCNSRPQYRGAEGDALERELKRLLKNNQNANPYRMPVAKRRRVLGQAPLSSCPFLHGWAALAPGTPSAFGAASVTMTSLISVFTFCLDKCSTFIHFHLHGTKH